MNIKNILYIGSVYPTLHGASVAAKFLVEGLRDAGYNVSLLNTVFNESLISLEKFSLIKIFKFVVYYLNLLLILIFKKIDCVIIIHSLRWIAFYKDSLYIRLCYIFNKKIILYAQGEGFFELFYEKLPNKKKKYIDRIFRKISKVVVVSNSIKKEYLKWLSEDDINVIFNICQPIIPQNEEIKKKDNEEINLLFLSMIIENKGIFILLEAFKDLLNKYNNLRLIVCGDFLSSREIDKNRFFNFIKDNKVGNFIDYRGRVSGELKKQAYLDADIFILPTLRESFGIVNIEAMSSALPVISTCQGAIPEYIINYENGFIVNPLNSENLSKHIELVLKDHDLKYQMGLNNREKFFEMFSEDIFINKWS